MDIDQQSVNFVFGVAALLFGGYSVVFCKLSFYFGEDQASEKMIRGAKARLIGVAMLLSSFLLLGGSVYGYLVLVISVVSPVAFIHTN